MQLDSLEPFCTFPGITFGHYYANRAAVCGGERVSQQDAAISELRFDVAIVLIVVTILLSASIDLISRTLRRALRISTLPTRLADGPVSVTPTRAAA